MKNLSTIGRILFALPFGIIGLNHFLMKNTFLQIMEQTSFIPGGGFTILFTGFILILASISIILNKFIQTTCLGLAGLLFIFIVTYSYPRIIYRGNYANVFIYVIKRHGFNGRSNYDSSILSFKRLIV